MEDFRRNLKVNCCFLPRLIFRYLGLSVNSNESVTYRIYSIFTLTFGLLFPLSSLHVALHNKDNWEVLCKALFTVFGAVTASAEAFIILYHRRRFEIIFDELARIQAIHNREEWSQKKVYSINKLVLTATVLFYIGCGAFSVITMTERIVNPDGSAWRTPVADFSLLNISYSPNFEIGWTYEVIAITVPGSIFYQTPFLVAAITVDITVQLYIFQTDIKKMFGNSLKDAVMGADTRYSSETDMNLKRVLKEVVLRHVSLINLVGQIERVCSQLVFVNVIGCLCTTCFSLYYASMLDVGDPKAIQSYFQINVLITPLFFICYWGTEMSHASVSVADACYDLNFTEMSTSIQKSLVLIIMRSQKPLKLTVGGFADLSVPVFFWILKSTYTYFTVLSSQTDDD